MPIHRVGIGKAEQEKHDDEIQLRVIRDGMDGSLVYRVFSERRDPGWACVRFAFTHMSDDAQMNNIIKVHMVDACRQTLDERADQAHRRGELIAAFIVGGIVIGSVVWIVKDLL